MVGQLYKEESEYEISINRREVLTAPRDKAVNISHRMRAMF